ncbi:hypothetical protein Aperf_G00000065930 [Anoplocephala perfoliata]
MPREDTGEGITDGWFDRGDTPVLEWESARKWLHTLTCGGSTNTKLALEYALCDPLTEAIYLITDGRPDQPTEVLLAEFSHSSKVPIHTVSFHCYDIKANEFLSEDLRLLREELMIGRASLEMMRDIYLQCYPKKTQATANSKALFMEANSTAKGEVSNLSRKKCKKIERKVKSKRGKLVPKNDKIQGTGNEDSDEILSSSKKVDDRKEHKLEELKTKR